MRTFRQHKSMLMYAVLAVAIACVVGLAPLQARGQDQYQDQSQSDQSYQQPSTAAQGQGRDMQLERQIANTLRQQGYGAQGEIMILATGDKVILLGSVPSADQKDGAEQAAEQAAGGRSIDNRLHVAGQARRMSDTQLARSIDSRLPGDLSQNVQVQARNGAVTLRGQLDNWSQVADAIDAAFAAGATQVNSQFSVSAGTATAQAGAGGYGTAPSQQGQPSSRSQQGFQGPMGGQGSMGAPTRASSSDLRLAQQVASQLRQQLPPGQSIQLVQPQSIYVTAQRGTVILHGYVQNNNQKQQAQQIARSIQGVQNVRNDLTILSTQRATGPGAGGQSGNQGFSGQGNQSYGGSSNQSGSYQPQGYISPDQSSQSQQGMSRQDQSGQSSGQPSFGGTTGQSQGQYGQGSSSTSQQSMGGTADQSQSSRMGGGQAAMSAADIALAQKVAQQLKQQLSGVQNIQAMRPGTIYVMAAQGNVMLHGFITDQNVKQQASQIANAVPGVNNVANMLRVIGGGAGSYPSYGYVPGQDQQSQQGAGEQSSSSRNQNMQRFIAEGGQTAGSQSDMALAQQVAQKLRQQLSGVQSVQVAQPGTIYVIVSKGTVTLDGLVPSSDAKQKAEQIAKSITGIQNVKNSLNIGGAASGNQTLGYMPPDEGEFAGQQYGNQQSGNQMPGNQPSGNQGLGNQPSENQSDEGQSSDTQPDEGSY
jgi:osmotically-inducible protein OsmY